MIERIRRIGAAWRKRRTLNKIRREFENHGHRLDGVPDCLIEAALTCGEGELNAASLSAKAIYVALGLLSSGGAKSADTQNQTSGSNQRSIGISESYEELSWI